MLFDCIEHRGAVLDHQTWVRRHDMLADLADGAALPVLPVFEPQTETVERLLAIGMEGAVTKHRAGRYLRGRRSATWCKHKGAARLDGQVVAVRSAQRGGPIERVGVLEDGSQDPRWARVLSVRDRERLASWQHEQGELRAVLSYTYRSPAGRLREARLVSLQPDS
jgi:hypothetical protein